METWFNTVSGVKFLSDTYNGKFAFVWVALNSDGSEVKQFEETLFDQLITSEAAVPRNLDDIRGSVDKLDVRKVQEFYLFPTGAAKKHIPMLQPIRLVLNLEQGEKFISYWLTDHDVYQNTYFYRHVIGISKPVNGAQAKFFAVLNPIGRLTIATSDDQSYAGE